MRQTAKLRAAHALIHQLYSADPKRLKSHLTMDHETLYETLHDAFYVWEPKRDKWIQLTEEEREFTGGYASRYVDRDGQPSGIFDLRIMAHPDDAQRVAELLQKYLKIGRITDAYRNRGGEGVRFYITARLPQAKGKARK